MVSFGTSKGTKSTSRPIFQYLPGQLEYLPTYLATMREMFEQGPGGGGTGALLTRLALEQGRKEVGSQELALSRARGVSTPARQAMLSQLTGAAVSAAAGAPIQSWTQVAEWLGQFATLPPAVGTVSRAGGGGGVSVGLCSCTNLMAVNEGYLLDDIRKFRDSHFYPGSDIDNGYKAMSEWFVPLVTNHSFLRKVGRALLYLPLAKVAQWVYGNNDFGFLFIPFAYGWVWFWKLYGRLTKKRFVERTPRLTKLAYPTMTRTFFARLVSGGDTNATIV